MGRAVINLSDIMDLSENSDIPEPRWYPVKYKHDDNYDPENGPQVLVSFALVEYDHEFLIDGMLTVNFNVVLTFGSVPLSSGRV